MQIKSAIVTTDPELKVVFTRTALAILIALLLGETTINYVDRQVVSVLAPTLRGEFHLTNSQYAGIVNSFLIVYAVGFSAAGWALDRVGIGRGLTVSVIWWSIADMLHAFARGPFSLGFFRGLLAAGEATAWPAFAKAIARWVPKDARTLALGICNSGSSIGAIIAPPLVVWITLAAGWRAAFIGTGLLGFLWTIAFLLFRRAHPEMAVSERQTASTPRVPWMRLMRYRQTWAIFACRFLGDPMWYFFVFWIPEFLTRERGLSLAGIGKVAWIPFFVSGVANLGVGYLSLRLQRGGWSVSRTRKTFMVFATVMSPIGILAAQAHTLAMTMALISAAIFFWTFWSLSVHSLAGEYFPAKAVGSVYGISGTGSTLGSAISTWAVGRTLDATHNYTYVFAGLSLLMPVALLVGGSLMGRVEMIRDFDDVAPQSRESQ